MKLKAINDNSIDINGTSLKGYITTTRRSLNRAFGQVERDDFADKVQYEWTLLFEVGDEYGDVVCTIYDYKEYQDIPLDTLYQWHIGGNSPLAVACIYSALNNRGAITVVPDDFISYERTTNATTQAV
jgi:hypothetical protein